MTTRQSAALVLLAAIWGASYLFIRVAAPALGPFVLMWFRVLIAAAALWLFVLLRRERLNLAMYWRPLLLLGLVHAGAPFALIATAELQLSASLAAVLTATQPLFALLIGAIWLHNRVSLTQVLALLLGLAGVVVLLGWSPTPLDRSTLLSVCAVLAAAGCYAFGSMYAKQRLADAPVLTLALGQQLGAVVWLVLPALITLPEARPDAGALTALFCLALLCTAFAYVLFFWLNGEIGAIRAGTITYIIPVFGAVWGMLFLDEPVTSAMFAGLGCILLSMVLVNRRAGVISASARTIPRSHAPLPSADSDLPGRVPAAGR